MAFSSKLLPVLLLALLVATEMAAVQQVAAVKCQDRCKKCVGACLYDEECTFSCKREGYDIGECHGFNHRCICIKNDC
nr:defensin Ec-AMP-D1-like [Lolium perenne]